MKSPNKGADGSHKADELAGSSTALKLDWLTCVAYDPDISPSTFEVAFAIVQHVNWKKGVAYVSDATIAEKTGICTRDVLRARKRLRDAGWLTWDRTGGANIYKPLFDKMNAVLDELTVKRDARRERFKSKRRDQTQASYQSGREPTPKSERD
jgi:hypothetical protein